MIKSGVFAVFTLFSGLPVQGAILLFDNFNAATPNTFDLNVDIARQTGTLAPVNYVMALGPGNYGHQLQNIDSPNALLVADWQQSTSSLNTNFNGTRSAGGLRVSFDVNANPAVYGNADQTVWGALAFGASAANQLVDVNGAATHFGILFRGNGNLQAFDGGGVVGGEPAYSALAGSVMRHVEILFSDTDGNPFDGAGSTKIDVFGDVNGYASPVYTFTKTGGGYIDNYMNIQGYFRAHFDNLRIEQVPEPSALFLTGMAGLAALRRRRG
jgi:hypothetical protein